MSHAFSLSLLSISCFLSLSPYLLLTFPFSLSLFLVHNYSHISGMDFSFVIKLLFGSLLPSGKSPRPSMILSLIPSIVSCPVLTPLVFLTLGMQNSFSAQIPHAFSHFCPFQSTVLSFCSDVLPPSPSVLSPTLFSSIKLPPAQGPLSPNLRLVGMTFLCVPKAPSAKLYS